MENNPVLIIGSGHLSHRIKKLLDAKGIGSTHISNDSNKLKSKEDYTFDNIFEVLKDIDFKSIKMTYLVDDSDEKNLEFLISLISLNKDLPVIASLFNENISPHLRAAHPNVQIINPAKIASSTFIEGLYIPVKHSLRYTPIKPTKESNKNTSDNLVSILVIGFISLILLTTSYFHFFDNLSWINSIYFVVVTVATVGYGDISLLNSSVISKLVGISLILGSTFFIWIIFSLTVDRIIKKRVQLSLGRKKYYYKNHIILCGLGKLGYFIAEGLITRGEKVVIVEVDENSPSIEHFRNLGADVYIGNARYPRVLQDVGVQKAKAVFSVINNDYANIEIGLNARSFVPDLRLILRIFDESMSKKIKENLDIHITYSMSAIADEKFVEILSK